MNDRRDRDRDRKREWRDIDRRKDKSSHVDGSGPRRNLDERKVTTGYHRYKQDLDDLFARGEASSLVQEVMSRSPAQDEPAEPAGGNKGKKRPASKKKPKQPPARQKLLRSIRAASSPRELTRLFDEFLAGWELPEDIEILTQALEHEDEEIQAQALTMISSWLDGHVLRQKSVLTSRVRKLASRADDETVRQLARKLNRKL